MPGLPGGAYPGQVLFPLSGPSSTLTRVQSTGKVEADNTTTFPLTFATPPAVGNGIVIPFAIWASAAPATLTCVDNRGNTYALAVSQTEGTGAHAKVGVFYCSLLAASSGPFTITITASATSYFLGAAIEVGGLGGSSLIVDQTVSTAAGSTLTPTTGTSAALTGSEAFVAAALSTDGAPSTVTVASVSPAWTQEAEELVGGHATGECDSRIVTSAAGTTQSCGWTVGAGFRYAAALAAFTLSAPPPAAARVTQVVVDTLSHDVFRARVTQIVAETLSREIIPARVTQVVTDTLSRLVVPARVTQVVVDTLSRTPEARFTRDPAIGLTWVEFTDAQGTTHVWSDVPLPDPQSYYYGFKEARVTDWGAMRRSLSDDQGQYVGSDMKWTLSDADRAIRTMLADPDLKYVANRLAVIRMIPDAARRRLERPRTVYLGTVRDYQPASPLTFTVTAKDPFDAIFNPAGEDQQIPKRVVTIADFPTASGSFTVGAEPDASPPVEGSVIEIGAVSLPVPILYGVISDTFVMDGEDQGDGQCPAILVGLTTIGGVEYFQWLVAGHACQGIDEVYINNDPQLADDPALAGVGGLWLIPGWPGWDAVFATPYEDINGRRYTTVYGKRGADAPIVSSSVAGPTVLTAPGHGLVTGEEAIIANHQGSTPALNGAYVVTVVDADHFTIPVTVTAGGTGGHVLQPFGPDIAAGVVPPRGLSVPFALSVRGIEDVGDGTGSLLLDGPLQYLHALQNWIVGDYQSGAWLATPVFTDRDRTPQIDDQSFRDASAIAQRRISGGYRGDFVIGATGIGPNRGAIGGTRLSTRELLRRFNASFDLQVGFNRASQFMASMLDDSDVGRAALAVSPRLTDILDVVKDSLEITDQVPLLYNHIPYRHTEDYLGRMAGPYGSQTEPNWRSLTADDGVTAVEDTDSIAHYSPDPAHPTPMIAPTYLLHMVRGKNRTADPDDYTQGSATAADVVTRYLQRHRDPPRSVRLTTGLLGMNLDLGQVYRLTHFAGIGADGWTDRPLRIEEHEAHPGDRTVTLVAEDVAPFFPEEGA